MADFAVMGMGLGLCHHCRVVREWSLFMIGVGTEDKMVG